MDCILTLIGKITTAIALLVLLYALTTRKYWQKPLRIYWYFLLCSLLCYVLEQIFIWTATYYWPYLEPFAKICNIQSTDFLRITTHLTNFIGLGWFFSLVLKREYLGHWVKPISATLAFVVLINYFFGQGHNIAGGLNSTLSAVYCTVLPMLLMWQLFHSDENVPPARNPYFWINLGLLVPGALSLFTYVAGSTIYATDPDLYVTLNVGRDVIEILAQLATAVGYYYAYLEKYLN